MEPHIEGQKFLCIRYNQKHFSKTYQACCVGNKWMHNSEVKHFLQRKTKLWMDMICKEELIQKEEPS